MQNNFFCGASNTEEQFDFLRKIIPAAHRLLEDPLRTWYNFKKNKKYNKANTNKTQNLLKVIFHF